MSPAPVHWEIRLWKNIKKEDGDKCWEWQLGRNPSGYGIIGRDQSPRLAHRLAWESAKGPVPDELGVLHKCNNPPCCRPSHLYLGTNKENADDRFKAGTNRGGSLKGDSNPSAKLSPAQVIEIRNSYPGKSLSNLAKEYSVTLSTIHAIIKRRLWRHI